MTIKVGIFINPNAGGLDWEGKIERAKKGLFRLRQIYDEKIEAVIFPKTSSREEYGEMIRTESQSLDLVIGGGGDGTVSDGLNNAAQHCTFGYIPLGSGNNIRAALFIHRCLKGEKIVNADLIIDEADGQKCLFIGTGIDSFLMQASDNYRGNQWRGISRYIPSLIKAIRVRKKPFKISIDGVVFELESRKMVYVGKHPIASICLPVFPSARFDDGRMHCFTLNQYLLPEYSFVGKKIEITSDSPMLTERDGEVLGYKDSISVHIEKGARKILTAKL